MMHSTAPAQVHCPSPTWRSAQVMTFAGQRNTHIHTGEDYDTLALIQLFTLEPTDKEKGSGDAFIPSSYCDYDGREHARQRECGRFVALCGDVDSGDHDLESITALVEGIAAGSAWLVYSSAHSRPGDRRWRIILPLDGQFAFPDWHDAQLAFFALMEADGVKMDHALARAAQPVYLPNVPAVHAKSNTPLRSETGEPLYFERACSSLDAPALDPASGIIGQGISEIRAKREADDRERERIRQEAARRRRQTSHDDSTPIIADFNGTTSIATMLEMCGYEQSPRNPVDWRSPHQTGETYATRIIGDKWVSLSASDAAAGLGEKHPSGCFGDAYDLFVHFTHGGDHKAAFRELYAERRSATHGAAVVDQPSSPADRPSAPIVVYLDDQPTRNPKTVSPGEPFECTPVDLWARYEAPALPAELLPHIIERFAITHSETMGSDPAGLAMAALTVCAAAISDQIQLQVKRHDPTWLESARLWTALIGSPSTKKSPIMNAALRPLNKIDGELFREFMLRQEEYDALDNKERKQTPKPAQRRLRISDATVEAAQEVLRDSPDGVLSQQDELSGWFGAMDKYSAGKGAMADRGFWLQAFNGGSYALNRISRGASLIPNLSISILGGIQPDPLRRIVSESVDDGLIQRLLPIQLRPAVLGRDEPQDDSVRQYEDLVRNLWLLRTPQLGWRLRFSDQAHVVRSRLEERHLQMMGAEVISPKLGAHFGKYDGIFARLCVLWHCVENVDCPALPQFISGETALRVEAFLHEFIVPSAIAFYTGVLGLSDDHDTLIELATFILAHRLETVQHRDCQRASTSLKALTVEQSRTLFEKLESFGWIEPTDPPKNSKTPRWRVNPGAHGRFEERGKIEKERREKARAAIGAILSGEEG